MILNEEKLHQAQADVQKMWHFLEAARRTHTALDYERLAAPYLLQIQQRQQEIVEYLSTKSETLVAA